jgi:magnesium-transporting ATPase (P-type)
LATSIGKFGLISAVFIVIVLIIRFVIMKEVNNHSWSGKDAVRILDFFIIGVTVIVVAIPEGLPLSVTLSLAFSVKRMLEDQNLVRRM